ncbi:bleomycin resistance protein [Amycolatopsis nigrescens]|uniref:bleomycin resistance protein n=1 Tax=Amycolatopsis nigrescens TaxID=381445 RepID=UPI000375C87E|nr:VOC family protein [Amycolatopsis nigrescens]
MAEVMIPILPCRSINDVLDFYRALGFEVTYQQKAPNTFASIQRGDFVLQFFVLKAVDPASNYSTCYVLTEDVDTLYREFTDGLRDVLGKVPSRGVPRINPVKDMSYGVRQFIVVDPGGNYVRIGQPIGEITNGLPTAKENAGRTRLERALAAAIMLGDSKQDPAAAIKVLDRALNAGSDEPAVVRFRALVLRADLAVRLDDLESAGPTLDEAEGIELTADERAGVPDELHRIGELRAELKA